MQDRAREIAKATRLAHFERPDDPPARFSLVERAGRLRARIALNNA